MILGASGRARSGKTEICTAIARYAESQGSTVRVYDIGDLIRRYSIEQGRLPQVARADMTREQLQVLIDVGREKRAQDENFWITQMMTQIVSDAPDVALLPNLRFRNESAAVKAVGGHVVRVTRRNPDGSIFISEDRPPNDSSETSLDWWAADFEITAKSGEHELAAAFGIALYEYLRGKK